MTDSEADSSPILIENNENQKPPLTTKEKMKERLRLLGKLRPVNIATKPKNDSIVLETVEIKKEEVLDDTAKWMMEKVQVKEGTVIPTKSPKTPRSKKAISKKLAFKQELQEKLKLKRKEEQEERYMVYNADNEIVEEDPEEEEADFDISDDEEAAEASKSVKKPKIFVNEDEEIVDEEVDDEEDDEFLSDEEENELEEDEEEQKPKNPFLDDEASEEEDDDDDEEEVGERKPKIGSSRIIISDDEEEIDAPEKINATPTPTKAPSSPTHFSPIIFPNCITQRLEPYLGQQAPIEPDPSQHSIILDTQAEKEELMMLCSGRFTDTQKSDQTLCSKFEKYDVNDFLSDSSQILESQNLDSSLSIENAKEVLNDTQQRIEDIYNAFNNAEDTIVSGFDTSDSESEPSSRKRKVMVESDDEEIIKSKPKNRKLLSFDESDVESSLDASSQQKPANTVAMDFDDIFTTEDTSDNRNVVDNVEEEENDYGNDDEDDAVDSDSQDEHDEDENICTPIMLKNFVDDEASLSGDDVGDDPDDEDELNEEEEYELDEADKEEYDQEEVRNGLVQHYLKQVNDDDDKRLYRLQQQYFADGDLHGAGNIDRSFRFRMSKEISDSDWAKLVKMNPMLAKLDNDSDEEETSEVQKKLTDVKKVNLEKSNDIENIDDNLLDDFDSPLFNMGKKAMIKSTTANVVTKSHASSGSLLNNPNSLKMLMTETVVEAKSVALFTAIKKN